MVSCAQKYLSSRLLTSNWPLKTPPSNNNTDRHIEPDHPEPRGNQNQFTHSERSAEAQKPESEDQPAGPSNNGGGDQTPGRKTEWRREKGREEAAEREKQTRKERSEGDKEKRNRITRERRKAKHCCCLLMKKQILKAFRLLPLIYEVSVIMLWWW